MARNKNLLSVHVDLNSPMGISYERAIAAGASQGKRSDRHTLICPRGSCRQSVAVQGEKTPFKLDSSKVLWVPAGRERKPDTSSAIVDVLELLPGGELFGQIFADNGLRAEDRRLLESKAVLFKRTKWLDDILDRYVFERILNRHSPPGCTFFLEKQILNEVARIVFRDRLQSWDSKEERQAGFEAAVRFIEANLFSPLELEQISASAKISESTLLRSFKKETGKTPYEYIKQRRLDEAHALIRAGEHAIGDVAMLVGYEDMNAFTRAFRLKFGKPPSAFKT